MIDPSKSDPGVSVSGQEILYGEQTRLAVANFRISGLRFPRALVGALGLIKACAARVNRDLGILPRELSQAIEESAMAVAEGMHDDQFPVDVFQTGSGASTNLNADEVVAALAARRLGRAVHPNDDVNRGQSSNDVIPTAIHVGAALELGRAVIDVARDLSGLSEEELLKLLDPERMARPHDHAIMP
jgi:fumarate hydratase class II